MIQSILSILAGVLSLYSTLCLIYILMSWFPGAKFTKFGRIMSRICEPYMNLFRRLTFLRIGNIDFSPIVSLGILVLISTILGGIQRTGRIFVGGILATILESLWSITSSIISLFAILIFIRWISLLISKGRTSYDSGWNQVDMILNKFTYKLTATFTKKPVNYQNSLLISWIVMAVFLVVGYILIFNLRMLCYKMPF